MPTKRKQMNCDQARNISIVDLLAKNGILPEGKNGSEYLYKSPFRSERTPSFFVNIKKNAWNDFGSGEGGNIIDLVQLMFRTNITGALKILGESKQIQQNTFSLSKQESGPDKAKLLIKHLQPIQNKALIQYLNSRKIPFSIASKYLKEAYYLNVSINKQFFALAFRNDKGGFALSNGLKKGKLTVKPGFYTTIQGRPESVNIFEGFFNFLSALVYYKTDHPENTTIVLNSLSNLNKVIPILCQYKTVNLYLDHDSETRSGEKATEYIKDIHPNTIDQSNIIYPNYKDFNEYVKLSTNL